MILSQIKLTNIQCHKELVINFSGNGVTCFVGDNSNGKSVTVKVTKDLITGAISRPKVRAALINRKSTFGEALYIREDNVELKLHLTREAATTWVSYTVPGSEPIQRYLADKTYVDLVRKFGWHYNAERDISLNIAENDAPLLFFTTSFRTNYEVIDSARMDYVANTAVENMEQLIKETRTAKENAVTRIQQTQATLSQLAFYNIDEEMSQREKLEFYRRNLSIAYIPQLPEIVPVPDVKIINLHVPVLPPICYPKVYDIQCNIPDIYTLANEIKQLENNICPTCGRRFIDACTHTMH